MIGGLIGVIIWWFSGGFDWVFDFFDCYKYDSIARTCEYLLEHHINIVSYEDWRTSVTQTWEFNRQVGIPGGLFEMLDNQAYQDMRFMIRTYQQELGMYNFFKVYV